jgi:hypothetical protein
VPLQTRSIRASKGISQFNSISASKCISKLTPLRPTSTSPTSTDHGLQVDLQTHSIAASKYISHFARLPPPSASLSSLNQRLQVLLRLCSSTACSQIGRMYIYRETEIDNTCHIMM